MNRTGLWSALAWLAVSSSAASADLATVDRALTKEPKYQSAPRYCLLVFGPEAKTRVWLVHHRGRSDQSRLNLFRVSERKLRGTIAVGEKVKGERLLSS